MFCIISSFNKSYDNTRFPWMNAPLALAAPHLVRKKITSNNVRLVSAMPKILGWMKDQPPCIECSGVPPRRAAQPQVILVIFYILFFIFFFPSLCILFFFPLLFTFSLLYISFFIFVLF